MAEELRWTGVWRAFADVTEPTDPGVHCAQHPGARSMACVCATKLQLTSHQRCAQLLECCIKPEAAGGTTQLLGGTASAQCSQSPTRVAASKVEESTQQAQEEACEAHLRREITQTATDVQSCSCQQRCPWVVTHLSKCPQTIGQSWPIELLHHK